jgi:hypothetical protein
MQHALTEKRFYEIYILVKIQLLISLKKYSDNDVLFSVPNQSLTKLKVVTDTGIQ